MRYAKRTDANHAAMRDALRSLGWDVMDLSGAGDGIPDLCVYVAPGVPHFIEIKDGDKPLSAQKLTKAQEKWHAFCWRVTSKCRNLAEAVAALEWARGQA